LIAAVLASLLTLGSWTIALAAGPSAPEPQRRPDPAPAAPRERFFSMWVSVDAANASDATVHQTGIGTPGGSGDVGPFVLLGGRFELYPSVANRWSRHFGFGIELEGFAGEADVETHPGLPAEQVNLTGAVVAPSFIARVISRSWEGYGGVGTSLLWVTRLSGATGFSMGNDDTDAQAPLGLSAFAGVRRLYPGRWFFTAEVRHRTGDNRFHLTAPDTRIDLDWRMSGIAVGTGYWF
jgi:hypothetical protein